MHELITTPFIASLFISACVSLVLNEHIYFVWLAWYSMAFMIAESLYYIAFMPKNFFNYLILVHHAVTILIITWPLQHPEYDYCVAASLLVEFNTLFLKLRHLIDRSSPWYPYIDQIFRITWVPLRLIYYPVLLLIYYQLSPLNKYTWLAWPNLLIPHTLLIIFYFYWSYDLFLRKKNKPIPHDVEPTNEKN